MKEDEWPGVDFLAIKNHSKRVGDLYTTYFTSDTLPALPDSSLFFSGSFYLLSSPATFFSAHITALQVKCSQIGTIIGQPTGEDNNLTGEIIEMPLPNTLIRVVCPTARYQSAGGDAHQIGVQPDVFVIVKRSDLLDAVDWEQQELIKIISQ